MHIQTPEQDPRQLRSRKLVCGSRFFNLGRAANSRASRAAGLSGAGGDSATESRRPARPGANLPTNHDCRGCRVFE